MTLSLHSEALAWLRYAKRMPIVCTEQAPWNADVIGMNSAMCIEVEVKKSISDLRAEFKNKRHKHFVYDHAKTYDTRNASGYIPNYFYFFTPKELAEKAEEIIREKCPKAGLAVVRPGWSGKTQGLVEIYKRPAKLHDRPPSSGFVRAAVMRMASEVCIAHMALDRLKVPGGAVKDILAEVAAMEGTLDFENNEASLTERGQLMAKALGHDWQVLPDEEKIRYIFVAQTFLTARNQKVTLNAEIV